MVKLSALMTGILMSSVILIGGTVSSPAADANGSIQIHIIKTSNLSFVGTPSITSTTANSAATPDFVNREIGYAALGGEVIKTTNGGHTWKPVSRLNSDIQNISFSNPYDGLAAVQAGGVTTNPSQLTAGYTWAIYRTTNGGTTWTEARTKSANKPLTNFMAANFHFSMFGLKGYAVLNGNLLMTRDGGQEWMPLKVLGQVGDAIATSPNNLWVVTSAAPYSKIGNTTMGKVILLHSTDGGQHFHRILETGSMSLWQTKLAFDSTGQGILLVKNLGTWATTVYWTTDAGQKWQHSQPTLYDGRIAQSEPVFGSSGAAYIALAPGAAPFSGGVTKFNLKTGKASLMTYNNNWNSAQIGDVQGNVIYASASLNSGGNAIFRSTDYGKSWSQVYPAGIPNIQVFYVSQSVGYGLGINQTTGFIYKTVDGGHQWIVLKKMHELFPNSIAFVNAKTAYVSAYVPNGTNGFTTVQLLITHNAGVSWSRIASKQMPSAVTNAIQGNSSNMAAALSASVSGISMTINNAYPTIVMASHHGSNWGMTASFSGGLGMESAAYVTPNDLWISSVSQNHVPTKTNPSIYTSTIYQVDGLGQKKGLTMPLFRLPKDWIVLGMTRPDARNAYIYAQNPFLATGDTTLFVTHDGGKSWVEYRHVYLAGSSPVPLNLSPSGSVMDLSFITANDGYMLTANGLLKTTDGGMTWTYIH